VACVTPGRIRLRSRIGEGAVPYLFIAPAMVGLFAFKLYPIVAGLRMSFYDFQLISGSSRFIGIENYRAMFADPTFWHALRNTLVFNLLVTPLQVAAALGLAMLVNSKMAGVSVFRSAYFLPAILPLVVASVIWDLLYHPDNGVFNGILGTLGLPRQPFLVSAHQAMGSVIAMVTWKGAGYWMVILLAGLQNIPEQIYEAARIEGARGWTSLWRITLPLLSGTLVFVTVADTAINFLLFAPVYVMTQGGPSESTTVLMFEVYRNAFVYLHMGYATAIATVLLTMTLVVVAVQMRVLPVEFEY
jgi:multiple sugar transport system permease protein